MNWRTLISSVLASLVLTSCATPALWEHTNPREYVVIKRTPAAQARLEQSGLDYRVDEERGFIFVEKTKLRKLRDYSIRFFVTPVAIAADASAIGAAIYVLSHGSLEDDFDYHRTPEQNQELENLQKTMKEYGSSPPR